jgi:hypothetical protein
MFFSNLTMAEFEVFVNDKNLTLDKMCSVFFEIESKREIPVRIDIIE